MRIVVLLSVLAVAAFAAPRRFDAAAVTSTLNSMVAADSRLTNDVELNYQNMASKKSPDHDNAHDPLFTSVAASRLQQPTFSAFTNLLKFYSSHNVDEAQQITAQQNSTIDAWFAAVLPTSVMQIAQTFLAQQGLASADQNAFQSQLYNLWFAPYARNTVAGSSGFKSVFSGEYDSSEVTRFGSWLGFYEQEAAGSINYHGWFTKTNGIVIDLQFLLDNVLALERSILLNTSPEFEFAAYTVCALTKSPCTFEVEGDTIHLTATTLSFNGLTVLDEGFATGGSSTGTTKHSGGATTKKPVTSDADLQKLVDDMWASDTYKPSSSDIELNWGNKVSGKSDTSPNPLFTKVNEEIFNQNVYKALITTYDQNLFTPDVCTAESAISGFKKTYLQAVINAFTGTPMFQSAFAYLQSKNVHGTENINTFISGALWNLWFGTYSRCKGTLGSSGWEHVFSGEWKSGDVDGQHDWVRYYLLEKAGKINYHGYYSHDQNLIGTFQYTWENDLKPKGGFFTGTSPAFDFSILTVCALSHSGANGCRFNLDGYPISVTSYTQSCDAGTCLSTAYPSDG